MRWCINYFSFIKSYKAFNSLFKNKIDLTIITLYLIDFNEDIVRSIMKIIINKVSNYLFSLHPYQH